MLQKCESTDIALTIYQYSDPIDKIRLQMLIDTTSNHAPSNAQVSGTISRNRYRNRNQCIFLRNELVRSTFWKILQKCESTDFVLAIYESSRLIDKIRLQMLIDMTRNYPLPVARVYTTTPPDRYRIEICSILLHLAHTRHESNFWSKNATFLRIFEIVIWVQELSKLVNWVEYDLRMLLYTSRTCLDTI